MCHYIPGSLYPATPNIDGEGPDEVTAELHTDTHCHHQVDQGHRVQGDIPPVHQTAQVDDDQDDDDEVDDGGHQVESHQDEGDDEYCSERDCEGLECVVPHGQILLVENIEDRVGEDVDVFACVLSSVVDELHDAVGELPGACQGHVVIPAGLQDGVECHHVRGTNSRHPLSPSQLHRLSVSRVAR